MCNGVRWSNEAGAPTIMVIEVRKRHFCTEKAAAFKFFSALGVVAQNLEWRAWAKVRSNRRVVAVR